MTDVIDQYAKKDGPLPQKGSGSIAAAFWRGYRGQTTGLRGGHPTSPAGRAFKAGLKRRKVQPDLEQ